MSNNEFVQLAGCANGYVINKDGVVKYPNGRVIKILDGEVTVKLVNGNHRVVKVLELLERNFGVKAAEGETKTDVESNEIVEVVPEVPQEPENAIVRDLSPYGINELEAEIKRRKLKAIERILISPIWSMVGRS